MRMAVYVIRRVALVIPVLLGVMTVVFLLIAALPVSDQILAQHSPPPHTKCSPTQAYCSCVVLGIGKNTTAQCKNPLYWKIYDQLGLDQPVPVQWAKFMYRSLTFQWGNVANGSTLVSNQPYANYKAKPVTSLLGAMLPYTLELAILALIIILAISIPLGNLAAVNRNRPIDQASRVLSFSGFALPAYLLGSVSLMGVVILVGSWAHGTGVIATPWCPTKAEPIYNEFTGSWPLAGCYTSGPLDPATNLPAWLVNGLASTPTGFPTVDAIYHHQYWLAVDTIVRLLLPALVIAYGAIAGLLRFVRNSMLEVMNLDYIRTARAKGVPEKTVVRKHAGRNSMNVTITVLGLTFAFFIGGFPVIEDVFSLNGVGRALALSVQANGGSFDFGTIFGSTLLFTYLVVTANIIVDVLYAYLDPRVRLG
jgi:ABC-type dipeptide/oligopeptide/nickel transport system permease component